MISVIIPMYNSSKYIKKCIFSVLNSTYQDVEIIVIDDGSSDESVSVVNSINNNKIRVFHTDRKGPGFARNIGIKNAIGEYLFFLDSDDYIEDTYLESLINSIKEKDVIVSDYKILHDDGSEEHFVIPEDNEFNTFFESVTVWNRLYKSTFINNNNIWFETISQGEDRLFLADLYLNKPKVEITHDVGYNWCRHESDSQKTLTGDASAELFDNQVLCMKRFYEKLAPSFKSKELKIMLEHLRYSCIYLLDILKRVESNTYDQKQFKNFISLLKFDEDKELYKQIFNEDWSSRNG